MKHYRIYFFIAFYALLLQGCKTYHVAREEVSSTRINESIDADSSVWATIQPYKIELDAEMDRVLAYNTTMLEKGKPESTLTNWFSDVIMNQAEEVFDEPVAFAIQNYGGIRRTQLGAGNVTVGNVFELMPFDNEMVLLSMSGSEVRHLLDRMASVGGWPVSRELRFQIKDKKAVNITIRGEPLVADKKYGVVMPDYIANGGDGLKFLIDIDRVQKGVLIRDAVIRYLEMKETIDDVSLDGRITIQS
ncbi:MAG: 5'-nucleotidase [Saprospiraceae bacterium]|nr:5'-nucleotidase [Saprospiraceae bacterium]